MSCNEQLNMHEMGVTSGERGRGEDRKFSITEERKHGVCVWERERERVCNERVFVKGELFVFL